jgi:hypothetical protein
MTTATLDGRAKLGGQFAFSLLCAAFFRYHTPTLPLQQQSAFSGAQTRQSRRSTLEATALRSKVSRRRFGTNLCGCAAIRPISRSIEGALKKGVPTDVEHSLGCLASSAD